MQNKRDPNGIILWAVGIIITVLLFLVGLVANGSEITIAKSILLFPVITGTFIVTALVIIHYRK